MRTIKFKLYYKNQVFGYEWLDEKGWHHSVTDLIKDADGTLQWQVDDKNELVRAQFTGLKDLKGNEIYEGDIVEVLAYETDGTGYRNYQSGKVPQNYLVEYDLDKELVSYPGSWGPFSQAYDGEYGEEEYKSENTKVIGNIFENPELLKSK